MIFKTAVRSIKRNKVFSIINVVGLALGIAVFLLIAEFIASEWSANRFHKNFKQLFRVGVAYKDGSFSYYTPPGYAGVAMAKFPEIKAAVRVAERIGGGVISYQNEKGELKTFREDNISYADGNFLQVFSFPIVTGSASLARPKTLSLTENMATKIFGKAYPIGKTVTVSNQFGNTPYTVTSVIKNITNSDINAEVFLSIHTLESPANRDGNDWADPNTLESGFVNLYFLLRPDASANALAGRITSFVQERNKDGQGEQVILQQLKYIHLAPSLDYPYQSFGSLKLVYMLGLVALLILLIAWVNYVNLSTVQAMKRAKETGVRKVLGAGRWQLARQFLTETFVITTISVLLALAFVQIFQPLFNRVMGKKLSLDILIDPVFLLFTLLTIFIGSLLSGGYVAFVLSSFKPIATLKGKLEHSFRGILLRKGLVVFQFSISVVFIIATIVLYKQLSYMQTESLGMKLDELLVIQGPTVSSDDQAERNLTFKSQIANLPFVQKVAASNNIPGQGYNFSTAGITRQNPQPDDGKKSYNMFIADQNYFDTYGINFVEGKAYSENDAFRSWNNQKKVVINQKAAAQLGFAPGEPVTGKKILWGAEFEVVGVVKDYHHLSLRSIIEPVIYLPSVSFGYFTIKTGSAGMQDKIKTIEKMYKASFPGNPFDYFFADEAYDKQYRQEKDLGNVFIAAACIAIFIACLGLFGLAAFSAQQRVKEIGVRKVLGADVGDIVALLSRDFVRLVLVAIVIGSPIAWWAMTKWLQSFPYRTGISWWIFLGAGLGAVTIAMVTVSLQAVKAARMNPVKSLRTE